MSDFYSVLADHYDELFGCSERVVEFLRSQVPSLTGASADVGESGAAERALDVGCGTGACTRKLLEHGADAYGVDLCEPMIERGRELMLTHGFDQSRLAVGDMLKIHGHPAAPFDLVFCIGNTIAHLPERGEVHQFVRAARSAIRGDGVLVVQFVSVGDLEPGERLELPDLSSGPLVMRRVYERTSRDEITFHARLGEHEVSQRLLVLTASEVTDAMRAEGLREIRVYGGFDRSDPKPEAWVRVIVGRPGVR
ncbi:MAG: class I SAM-dependent methyltransferase, partial [Spirochaetota bacterium]